MSEAVVALIGVVVGGVLSAIASPWLSARLTRSQRLEDLQQQRIGELAAVMDDAGLALERFHWSLRRAIDDIGRRSATQKDLETSLRAVHEAQDYASSLGSRLAIRLGPADESKLVAVYDEFQAGYRALTDKVLSSPAVADAAALRGKLQALASHREYFLEAKRTRAALENKRA